MRRWLIALATALVAGALWVGAAYADDTIYHGGYNATGAGAVTNRCAGCHRTHTASGDGLIKASTTYGLCTSCHGTTSGLDVVDGVEWQTDGTTHAIIPNTPPVGGTKGGGFMNSYMNTTLKNPPTALKASTSSHKVNGQPNFAGPATVWGIGAIGSGAGSQVTLECISCHDPHGGSGGVDPTTGKRIPTYRILRANVAAKVPGAAPAVIVPEDTAASHEFLVDSHLATDTTANSYYGQTYANTDMSKLSAWCATCHTRIHTSDAQSAPGSSSSGDAIYNFRHSTVGTSVENNLGTSTLWPAGSPGCVTCHVGHGSSAASTSRSAQVPKPGTAEGAGTYLDSSLLRLDNHGVCEVCHNK